MAKFTPTAAERKKYADYSVEIRQGTTTVSVGVERRTVYRWLCEVRRVPSTRTFIVYLKQGITADEEFRVRQSAERLPKGLWAAYAAHWHRRRAKNGQLFFGTLLGWPAPDPLLQLEFEMLMDQTRTEVAP